MGSFRLTLTSVALAGGIAHIVYRDQTRYSRMARQFAYGNVLPPISDNDCMIPYFPRPEIEKEIRQVLKPTFTNQYYLIQGQVGSGKSRILTEMVKEMMTEASREGKGAPVYVRVSQGASFPDALAESVNFTFDEHLNFRYLLNMVLSSRAPPLKSEGNRVGRVLNAIETAAYEYTRRYKRPLVLIVDEVQLLLDDMPDMLNRLQEKAKLWADLNIVKLVLVANSRNVALHLQQDPSRWSRADVPIEVGDLDKRHALNFITKTNISQDLNHREAEKIYESLGGRIQHLITPINALIEGQTVDQTLKRLRTKHLKALLIGVKSDDAKILIKAILGSKDRCISLSEALKIVPTDVIDTLEQKDIIKIQDVSNKNYIFLESKLTELCAEELFK